MLHLAAAAVLSSGFAAPDAFDTIAFGSCARERQAQPIWTEILATQPDLFLFIGDNQYADFWEKDGRMVMEPVPNPGRIQEAYDALAAQPGYRRMQRACPIMATWDDHDYGANDAGNDFAFRAESQDLFCDFYGFGDNHPIREQAGIYHSRFFDGPRGERVQVIMLDTRYHRDPLERSTDGVPRPGPYAPTGDTSKTILGEAQWAWLAGQFREHADVRILASSIQIVADEHGWETWGNFPHERDRLYALIESTNASGVLAISGDRHLMELSCDRDRGAPYPLWDFTSSGLTQKPQAINDPNPRRVGPVRRETNFGLIRFEWGETVGQTAIHLEGYGDRGQMLTRQTVWLSDLSGD
jgi:alkaline phosphatase D